jgi:GDSL-like lipase/acylhydrolase family protein
MAMTRTFGALAALGAAAAVTVAAAPASAANSYVALGDSYASGTGTRTYLNDGTSCQRSVYAYPSLISASKGLTLNFRACSGAKVADVTNTQLSALTAATTRVSISVGGNDAGFADVLTECALPGWASDCNGAIDDAQAIITNTLPARLSSLYTSIRSKAPNAKVVVVGYPRIFQGEDCNAFTWFSPAEETRLNQTADLLNSKTSSLAGAKGFSFANPTSRFSGHAVCDSPEWLNGLSNPVGESYHPNVAGHRDGLAPLVSPVLTGSALQVNAATMRRAEASADTLAAQQSRYAAADASIRPERFRSPDLSSPAVKAAAKRAGVDLGSRASIDAADRTWSQRQAAAHAAAR